MKPLLLSILFTITAYSSFSQKIRFTNPTNHWITGRTYYDGTTFTSHQFGSDTTLNGVKYLRIAGPIGSYLVREDTSENRIYYRHASGQLGDDTTEYLGYDYNWKIGDTVTRYTVKVSGKIPVLYLVDNIDSILIQNTYHKVWEFSALPGAPTVFFGNALVIEGVGSSVSPTWPFNLPDFMEGSYSLYCFMTNNNKPKFGHLSINTHSCIESVDDNKAQDASQVMFPNPVTFSSQLNVSGISKGYLIIWNVLGQEVYRQQLKGEMNLPIGQHVQSPGMYFYQLLDYTSETKKVARGSFIRE